MKTVGQRREPEMTFHASGVALMRTAQFTESLGAFGGAAVAIKGVRRFPTHEQANRDTEHGIAQGMVAGRSERR